MPLHHAVRVTLQREEIEFACGGDATFFVAISVAAAGAEASRLAPLPYERIRVLRLRLRMIGIGPLCEKRPSSGLRPPSPHAGHGEKESGARMRGGITAAFGLTLCRPCPTVGAGAEHTFSKRRPHPTVLRFFCARFPPSRRRARVSMVGCPQSCKTRKGKAAGRLRAVFKHPAALS